MQIKVGDLVYIKAHSSVSIRENNDIWLVLGKGVERVGSFSGFIRIQNIRNGKRVQYSDFMLMKIETDKI
jgi:hypothetical protein